MTLGGCVRGSAARTSAFVAVVAASVLACDPAADGPAGSTGEASAIARSAAPGSEPPLGRPAVSASPLVGDGAVEFAIADLVDRLGYDPADVMLVSIDAVEWPTSALGCPQAGQEYEPGPVPGYRVVLQVDDKTYQYHAAAGDTEPFRCLFLD
jgi:hypothetical protein